MARRPIRPIYLFREVRPGRRGPRIRIPQPPYRPIHLMRPTALRPEPRDTWWFVEHRRGVQRPWIGEDPLEARAVSAARVRGTLPERIMLRNLLNFRLIQDSDFSFQTSLAGGRLELGGIVADFILPQKRIVIRIQGPTHEQPLRAAKDAEQKMILEDMGYWVVDITDEQVYDRMFLEEWTRNLLGFGKYGGGMADRWAKNTGNTGDYDEDQEIVDLIAAAMPALQNNLEVLQRSIW